MSICVVHVVAGLCWCVWLCCACTCSSGSVLIRVFVLDSGSHRCRVRTWWLPRTLVGFFHPPSFSRPTPIRWRRWRCSAMNSALSRSSSITRAPCSSGETRHVTHWSGCLLASLLIYTVRHNTASSISILWQFAFNRLASSTAALWTLAGLASPYITSTTEQLSTFTVSRLPRDRGAVYWQKVNQMCYSISCIFYLLVIW